MRLSKSNAVRTYYVDSSKEWTATRTRRERRYTTLSRNNIYISYNLWKEPLIKVSEHSVCKSACFNIFTEPIWLMSLYHWSQSFGMSYVFGPLCVVATNILIELIIDALHILILMDCEPLGCQTCQIRPFQRK